MAARKQFSKNRDQLSPTSAQRRRSTEHATCQAGASSISPALSLCPLHEHRLPPKQASKSRVSACICQPHEPGVRVSCWEIPVPALPRPPALLPAAEPNRGTLVTNRASAAGRPSTEAFVVLDLDEIHFQTQPRVSLQFPSRKG